MNGLLLSYLTPKAFEKKLYEVLAVDAFLKFTPLMMWARISGKYKPIVRSRRSALKYFRETVVGEMSHLASLLFLLFVSGFAFYVGEFFVGAGFFLLNVLVNLYPIFLMRSNRLRIAKALGKDVVSLLKGTGSSGP